MYFIFKSRCCTFLKRFRVVLFSCLFIIVSLPVFSDSAKDKIAFRKNTVMIYGGVGYGSFSHYERFKISMKSPADFGFIYQRDFLKRLSAELQFGGSYLNSLPSFMRSEWSYDSIRKHMMALAATEKDEAYANSWYRQGTIELTIRPVFHIISSRGSRLSLFAGLGYTLFDISTVRYNDIIMNGPIVTDVKVDMDMYRLDSFSWDFGLRYSYALNDRYVFGADLSYRDEFISKVGMTTPINRNFRLNFFFGLRF